MSVQGRKYLANTVLLETGLSLAFSEWIMKTVEVIDFRVYSAPPIMCISTTIGASCLFKVLLLNHSTFGNLAMVGKVHH